jgi:hypothetical protein
VLLNIRQKLLYVVTPSLLMLKATLWSGFFHSACTPKNSVKSRHIEVTSLYKWVNVDNDRRMEISQEDRERYARDYEINKQRLEEILAPAKDTPHRDQWISTFQELLDQRLPIQDILTTLSEKKWEETGRNRN